MNTRPYKQRFSYATITGTEPEYLDCKTEVTSNPAKYEYKTADYPCATARELAEYTELNTDANISKCYSRVTGGSITHASKNTKLSLPDGALLLPIPGYIDKAGERTVYSVKKDCSITVTTFNTYTAAIIKQETISRGQFNSKYKIDESTTPPVPEPDGEGEGEEWDIPLIGDLLGGTTDEEGNLTKKGWILAGGGAAALIIGSLVLGRFVR